MNQKGDTIEDYYGTSREGLINWVLTDTATLSYPFTRSIEKKYVTIATSDDNLLRIYSWNTGLGGTMIRWDNLVQYKSGDEVKSAHHSLDMQLHPQDSTESEIDYCSLIDTIYTYNSLLYIQPCFNHDSPQQRIPTIILRLDMDEKWKNIPYQGCLLLIEGSSGGFYNLKNLFEQT